MTEQDIEQVDDVEEGDAKLMVVSAEEYAQTRKVKEIMDARKEVKKARRNADDPDERDRLVAEAIAEFAMELEPLMEETEFGRELLNERDYSIDSDFPVQGLAEYMNATGYIKPTDYGKMKPPHPHISMMAYRDCNRFLRKIGLDLNLEEETEPAQI